MIPGCGVYAESLELWDHSWKLILWKGNWGPERYGDLLKVTQILCDKSKIQAQIFLQQLRPKIFSLKLIASSF